MNSSPGSASAITAFMKAMLLPAVTMISERSAVSMPFSARSFAASASTSGP